MPILERYFRWKITDKPIDIKAEDEWIDQAQTNLEVQKLVKEYRESIALQKLLNIELEEGDSFTEDNIRFYLYYIKPVSPIVDDEKSSFEQDVQKEQPIFEQNEENEDIKQLIPAIGDLPLGSYIPFAPNPIFTGRESDLRLLAKSLIGQNAGITSVVNQVVTGMGGIGKTQLAIEFAYRYGRYFRGVHWLNLADPTLLESEITQCGMQMALVNWPDDQASQVALTLNTWKSDGPRLLVLDNFEDIAQASTVLSKLSHTNLRLLITSRRSDWPSSLSLNHNFLNVFTEEEGKVFLKRTMGKREETTSDLSMLAERLGHLPLALELASRYLNVHIRLSINEYLSQAKEAFEHPSMRGLRADSPTSTSHDLDLQMTFSLAWKEINNDKAESMFQLAGYLAPSSPIPLEIFEHSLELPRDICDEILSILYGLGLFRADKNDLPAIHPLLAEYARLLSKENKLINEKLATTLVELSTKAIDSGLPSQFAPLKPHIATFVIYAEAANLESTGVLWNNYGSYLMMIADYAGAHVAFERALSANESFFGKNHLNVAVSMNNLGNVSQDLGDLNSARQYYARALQIVEETVGSDHPGIAITLNNLGSVLQGMGDLSGARVAFERALKIDEVAYGSNHPNVARDINNLGYVMQALGDLSTARSLYERALKINESVFGNEHPSIANNISNLGLLMKELGDLNGARTALERSLKINELVFGNEHPSVAINLTNLGLIMKESGDLKGARAAFERALKLLSKFLPPDHPEIKRLRDLLE